MADVRTADAALLDLDAPDCHDRATRLIAALPGLTVIACSAHRSAMLVVRAGAPAAERPCTPSALGACVRHAAARRGVAGAGGPRASRPLR